MEAKDEITGEKFSDKQSQEEVMTFLFAGHETTSSGLSWIFYLLSQHPVILNNVLDEFDREFGTNVVTCPTFEDVKKLNYLKNVIDEALRLYPPQPAFVRRALVDNKIGDYFIPKDTEVSVVPYLVHRNEKYWPNPETFNPDRFSTPESKSRNPFSYIPFSGGKRRCIGRTFALLETRIVITIILQHFTLHVSPGSAVTAIPAVTLQPHGLYMTVRQRVS